MTEFSDKPLSQISYCYLGDARNNMGDSLLIGGSKLGMDVRLCAPEHLWPADDLVESCRHLDRAAASGTGWQPMALAVAIGPLPGPVTTNNAFAPWNVLRG